MADKVEEKYERDKSLKKRGFELKKADKDKAAYKSEKPKEEE